MTLSTRISAFFLTILAVILLTVSVALYLIAKAYLVRQTENRLLTALDTLEAAVDVEVGGLEWEPQDRRITLGVDAGVDQVRWAIFDGDGRRVDTSVNATQPPFPADWRPTNWPSDPSDAAAFGTEAGWRLASKRLLLADLLRLGRGHAEDDLPDDDIEYPALIIVAGLQRHPLEANLRWLAATLAGLSLASLVVCGAAGRRISRRALEPVSQMAIAARRMTTADVCQRLPTPHSGDELEDLGRAFNELLARREESFERERRFTAEASHQLRTPLAGLLSLIDVIRRRPRPADEYESSLDQIRSEAVRLQQIIEALMYLARTETAVAAPGCEPLDLSLWAPQQLARWKELHAATDVQFAQVPPGAVWVFAQPALLAELCNNLLDNAAKYNLPGGKITVELTTSQSDVRLSVADQGSGIAASDLPHLFKPFFRADSARQRGIAGTGLGLAVAQRIANSFGGEITAANCPTGGSCFTLRLPQLAVRPPASSDATTREENSRATSAPGLLT